MSRESSFVLLCLAAAFGFFGATCSFLFLLSANVSVIASAEQTVPPPAEALARVSSPGQLAGPTESGSPELISSGSDELPPPESVISLIRSHYNYESLWAGEFQITNVNKLFVESTGPGRCYAYAEFDYVPVGNGEGAIGGGVGKRLYILTAESTDSVQILDVAAFEEMPTSSRNRYYLHRNRPPNANDALETVISGPSAVRAIESNPKNALTQPPSRPELTQAEKHYTGHGAPFSYATAIKLWADQSLREQGDSTALASLTWAVSTCPDARQRNPQILDRCIRDLEGTISAETSAEVETYEALAAAFARKEQFGVALAYQRIALSELQKKPSTQYYRDRFSAIEKRLSVYESKNAYTESLPEIYSRLLPGITPSASLLEIASNEEASISATEHMSSESASPTATGAIDGFYILDIIETTGERLRSTIKINGDGLVHTRTQILPAGERLVIQTYADIRAVETDRIQCIVDKVRIDPDDVSAAQSVLRQEQRRIGSQLLFYRNGDKLTVSTAPSSIYRRSGQSSSN